MAGLDQVFSALLLHGHVVESRYLDIDSFSVRTVRTIRLDAFALVAASALNDNKKSGFSKSLMNVQT